MSIHLKYYGVRGSTPTPGKEFDKFGGNSTCVYLKINDENIIIDTGSGIRNLGLDLVRTFPKEGGHAHIFFSHSHWDHIQGFPFFIPIYMPKNKFDIYGETKTIKLDHKKETWTIENILAMQQNFVYFPVSLENMLSQLNFHELKPETKMNIAGIEIMFKRLKHPDHSIGFRFNYNNKSFVYLTDIEHSEEATMDLVKFAEGADIMAYDCQYTPEEYSNAKIGWGHSTYEAAAELAEKAKVKIVHMIHHDPLHNDDFLTDMEKSAKKILKSMKMIPEGYTCDI